MRPNTKLYSIAATAGNAVATMPNNTSQDLELLYGHVSISTSAGVANRFVVLSVVTKEGVTLMDLHAGVAVAANASNTHVEVVPGVPRETAIVNNSFTMGFPVKLQIPAGGSLQVSVVNGVAADSFTGRFAAIESMV